MTGIGYDRYDAEWEHDDTGRTASRAPDDYCYECGGEVDEDANCDCGGARVSVVREQGTFSTRVLYS